MSKPYDRASLTFAAVAAAVVLPAVVLVAESAAKLDDATRTAITRAIEDEHAAQRFYEAVIARHGKVRPFTNVLASERRSAAELMTLARKHGVEVAAAAHSAPSVPDTLAGACRAAADAEREDAALAGELSTQATSPDVRTALKRLRAASAKRHLPAFEKCAQSGGEAKKKPAKSASAAPAQEDAGASSDAPDATELIGATPRQNTDATATAATCGSCGMGGCGCGAQSAAEKAARAAQAAATGKPAGCGCARARQQQEQK